MLIPPQWQMIVLHWSLHLKQSTSAVYLLKCVSRTTDSLYTPLNVKVSGAMRGNIFMQCHFPSPHGVTSTFTPHESPIYNLLYCCLRQLAHCCFSTFHRCVMLCEAVPHWTLAAFLLHAVHWWFSLLASPYRSCHPAVICLLWIYSPVALCYNVHRLSAEDLARIQGLEFSNLYEWKLLPIWLLIVSSLNAGQT